MDKILLFAVIAQLILTFFLMFMMGNLRIQAVRKKQVKISEIALNTDFYPKKVRQVANAFNNQFQMPILFFFGVALALFYGNIGWLEIISAYGFVVLRYIHGFIHITSNNPVQRLNAYFIGVLFLMAFLFTVFFKAIF
jgi:hypothetical protein